MKKIILAFLFVSINSYSQEKSAARIVIIYPDNEEKSYLISFANIKNEPQKLNIKGANCLPFVVRDGFGVLCGQDKSKNIFMASAIHLCGQTPGTLFLEIGKESKHTKLYRILFHCE